MRDVHVEHDREWLVIVVTRQRRDKPPAIRRMYLSRDEAAQVIERLKQEIPPVVSTFK